jgi:hypothetical protein
MADCSVSTPLLHARRASSNGIGGEVESHAGIVAGQVEDADHERQPYGVDTGAIG